MFHGTPVYDNKGFRLGTSIATAALLFPHMNTSWERFVHWQLECLAVLKNFTGHEIELLQTFFNILGSIFSDIPYLDQSII